MGTPQAPGYGGYPDLADTPGDVDTVNGRLAEVLPFCGEKIPETQFKILWNSMPDRVQAVMGQRDGRQGTRCHCGRWWRDVGEEVVVLAGGIKSSNFHFHPLLSHMPLKK